jgi:predicted transcriptional regulator
MNIEEIVKIVDAEVVEGKGRHAIDIDQVFASDLMSDVLTINAGHTLMLVTGLANIQTIRTCEMAEIKTILFVRGKKATDDMKQLASENEMVLMETEYSLYRTSGLLYQAGIKPVY